MEGVLGRREGAGKELGVWQAAKPRVSTALQHRTVPIWADALWIDLEKPRR